MLTFREADHVFTYRVAGLALRDEKLLVLQATGDDFWIVPGGRGEFFEPSAMTLRREMREELGIDVTIERLVWIVENFYEYAGAMCHELALYYEMSLPAGSALLDSDGPFAGHEDDGSLLCFRWHPISRLAELPLLPTFLSEGLQDIPNETTHIVHRDEK